MTLVFSVFLSLQIPAIHIVGNILFFHNQFLAHKLPYMMKLLDKKASIAVASMRDQWLNTATQNLPRYSTCGLYQLPRVRGY